MTADRRTALPLFLLLALLPATLAAQWTNRYPKLAGYSHHVYVEGYELPILNVGVTDPALSPNGRSIAIASRGWLWLLDPITGEARRITRGGGVDSRPAWSPDGRSLAFVRDDGRTTALMVLDLRSGGERVIERGLVLDPAFSADGRALYYSSSAGGDLDLWRVDLAGCPRDGCAKTRLTSGQGLELRPIAHPDSVRLLYLAKPRGGADEIRVRSLADSSETVLLTGNIVSQTRPALSPDGHTIAFSWPDGTGGWELRLTSLDRPGPTVLLARRDRGRPLTPSWSADGRTIYFVESDGEQRMVLKRVAAAGGPPDEVPVRNWNWGKGVGIGRLIIRTRLAGRTEPVAARLNITDGRGHPVIPERGQSRFDGQNGLVFFYSPGTIEVVAPAGAVTVSAVHGLTTPVRTVRAQLAAGETREVELELTPVWDPGAAGWFSGDHHFHLNYGGQHALLPEDLLPLLAGEELDVATPVLANLHNRFEDQEFWSWRKLDAPPMIRFGQEVRPHFLGHTSRIGAEELFWPWVWGPGYEVYGRDDRLNAEPLLDARREGGVGMYVHPVSRPDPFGSPEGLSSIPVALVADGVQGDIDALEVVCLWSDELGTSDVWYRLLNLGIPVAPSGGTDVMTDFYRTMALGTTRVYVRPDGPFNYGSYLRALKMGRSFVTNGPLLDFRVRGTRPGGVLARGGTSVPWTLDLYTAVAVEKVEILVNGAVAWSGRGIDSVGVRRLSGTVNVPAGGWVAARAYGGKTVRWPAMDSYAFAHTAPVWIERVGSTDPTAARAAARDLLRALDAAEQRLVAGYEGAQIPRLRAHFQKARTILEARSRE